MWTKDAVQQQKGHPHCQCLLIPRVSKVKQTGSTNYAEFIKNSPPKLQDQLLPVWAKEAVQDGVALDDLIKPDGVGLLSKQEAMPLLNNAVVEKLVAKLAEKAKNSGALQALLANPPSLKGHIDKRILQGHVKDETDYLSQVKAALTSAERFNLATSKFPSVELIGGNWSVILNHDGLIKTAYLHEKHMKSFADIQTQKGHDIYGRDIGAGLREQLNKLFDLR
ncbi:MAG: hypothetical protein ACNA7G_09620 [Methylobacter sp.]